MVRLHVSGWTQPVTEEDIRKRFVGLPLVQLVKEVVLSKKQFAHVEIELATADDDDFLAKLKQTYKHAKWKGGALQFALSQPDYRHRLEIEWAMQATARAEQAAWLEGKSTAAATALPVDQERALRIRRRKGEHITVKKPRVECFAEEEEEEVQQQPVYCAVPKSQDPAFCCSAGDAGPNTMMPLAQQEEEEEEPVVPATELALFAAERWREILIAAAGGSSSTGQAVKDAKFSLLGRWLKQSAVKRRPQVVKKQPVVF